MRYIFAGGGTGGHLFPGISVAQVLEGKDRAARILFAGTKKELEKRVVERFGFRYRLVKQRPYPRSALELAPFFFRGLVSFFISLPLFLSFRPDVAVGLGGYGSVTTLFVAHLLKVPIVILEQNSIPGRANILLSRWAELACVQFEMTRKYFGKCKRVEQTGNPVRSSLLRENRRIESFSRDAGRKTIVILGGSQGARPVNDKVVSELEIIERSGQRLQIIHQTGEKDFEKVNRAYSRTSLKASVFGFIDDIAAIYRSADLVIGRAGATTISELTALGIPSILVPLPHAKDNHQYFNAKELADRGAALIFEQKDFASRSLMEEALKLVSDEKKLLQMKAAARELAMPQAAERVADEIMKVARL